MTERASYNTGFTQNRELSWLKFNERILEEANDPTVPLFERLKFFSIFTSNLDEFFMIRVGSLYDLSLLHETHIDNKSGMTVQEQLAAVYEAVHRLNVMRDRVYLRLREQLRKNEIYNLSMGELKEHEKKFVQKYFESYVQPVLSPQIIDGHHPFPHLENKALYVFVMLNSKESTRFGLIPVPKSVPRLIFLPDGKMRYVLLENLIWAYAEKLFDIYKIQEKTVLCVTRNADVNPDDEAYELEEDFRLRMKKVLKQRARLAPVRLEVGHKLSDEFQEYLHKAIGLRKEQVYRTAAPMEISYAYDLESKLPEEQKAALAYPPFQPQQSSMVDKQESVLRQVARRDVLLYYPYESMDPFLRMVKEASEDPAVLSIQITLYRIDKNSRLAAYLIEAAERGKAVTVLMELRARFDEQNNIQWAERLEEAGCRILYGFEGIKVHSKICLITRREKNKLQYITQIGTGNYSEKTAKLYSDFSLMTADGEIGQDAVLFFKNMSIANLNGEYQTLLVAPDGFKRHLLELIRVEIQKALAGKPAQLLFKMNSLTDREIIDSLQAASAAGVQVILIIRGICCILPGIPSLTENVFVTSVVGRFLEHARVYTFGAGEQAQVYLSSADLMTRNTERRVEIACPVLDAELKRRVLHILRTQLSDSVKARTLLPGGDYDRVVESGGIALDCQQYFMDEAMRAAERTPSRKLSFLKSFLKRHWSSLEK